MTPNPLEVVFLLSVQSDVASVSIICSPEQLQLCTGGSEIRRPARLAPVLATVWDARSSHKPCLTLSTRKASLSADIFEIERDYFVLPVVESPNSGL